MRIINWTILSVGSVFLFCAFNTQAMEKRVKEEFKKRKIFSFKVERIAEVADCLSKIYQVPVCVEEARWFFREGEDSAEMKKILEKRRERGFKINAQKDTLKEILDKFIIKYPEYRYEFDENNIVFNLLPKTNDITDNKIDVDIARSSLEKVTMRQDVLQLKNLGIDSSPKSFPGNISWMRMKVLNLSGKGMRLYEVLNKISRQLPQSRYWSIAEREKHSWSTFWDGTKRIAKYNLYFEVFEPFNPSLGDDSPEHKKIMNIMREKWGRKLQGKVGLIDESSEN